MSAKQTRLQAAWISIAVLLLAILACSSSDTLFIHLTATPLPSLTPTQLSLQTKFQKGDQLYTVDTQRIISMGDQPGNQGAGIGSGMLTCNRYQPVTVLDISKSMTDQTDQTIFYQIDCGSQGWLPEYKLTRFQPEGGTAFVRSPDGRGAPLYKDADPTTGLASPNPCPEGTQVTIGAIARSVNLTAAKQDPTLYVEITCGDQSGFTVESMLALK